MKLVTFQSIQAVQDLLKKGYLECNEEKINMQKMGYVYDWIIEKMNQKTKNPHNTKYPLWCWVKCYNGICPAKRKGTPIEGFDVKITFNKNKKDVFITDYRKYSFLLNNQFIPNNLEEKEQFEKETKKYKIKQEELLAVSRKDKYKQCRIDKSFIDICKKIRRSFDRCITEDSDILQGCVWRIEIDEIDTIEILKKDGNIYGSLNYVRSNGERMNWIDSYYRNLK